MKRPVSVYVRGGTYSLSEPLVFGPEDSGTLNFPISYKACGGETPVLSGGKVIAGWKKMMMNRPAAAPEGGDLWSAEVPEVKEGKGYFHELFVNGIRRQRARTPNVGFFYVDGQVTSEDLARFKFHPGDIQPFWIGKGDVEAVVLSKWAEFRAPIQALDDATHMVTLTGKRQPHGDEKNARYWIENNFDALDAPGEWYLNRRAGVVYYRPDRSEDVARAVVVAPVLRQLVRLEGHPEAGKLVENLTFRGLTFAFTDWSMPREGYADVQAAYDLPAAVEMKGARNCSIEKCVFIHLGEYALAASDGSQGNRIVRNEMTDLGAGGIKIGEPKVPKDVQEATRGNVLSDNRIHDIGRVFPAAVGVWVGESRGNTISHNEIFDTFYTAISVGWTWGYGTTAARDNVIEFNHIHHVGRGMLSDMGCIYTLGVQPGTVERNNLCHDVERYERGYGGWGIYADEGSSNILVENNVVYGAEDGGFHQHYGRENEVRNNVFALGRIAQVRRTREENHSSFTFERNIVFWKEGKLLEGKWGDGHYRFDSNLYFSTTSDRDQPLRFADWSFESWQKRGQDTHSQVADPLFVDPEHGDFSLKPESPAPRLGFKPIDVRKVGPRK